MSNENFFPWHTNDLSQIINQYLNKKLAHALLISGEEDSGKIEFTRTLAQALMCDSITENQTPCGQCRS